MEAVAHNAAFAKKVGIPQRVGKEFAAADKRKKTIAGKHKKSRVTQAPIPGSDLSE